MLPGQTPYTEAQLKKLYNLISEAAQGDPGEDWERDVIGNFKWLDSGNIKPLILGRSPQETAIKRQGEVNSMDTISTATRYHEICCGHRVVQQGGKCEQLHGHNYRFTFTCQAQLNYIGMVIDFGIMKDLLCDWLETRWDHKFLMWDKDPWLPALVKTELILGIVAVPFNPTAENLAEHMLTVIGPRLLEKTNVKLVCVKVRETTKCSAESSLIIE
jgi:6-pyruvoyltetrahydropterin/6-carboxytetrahydropterin synthase